MTIRDRGKIKWQSASFIPLAFELTSEMFKDQARTPKPLLDENQTEEFDLRIAYATEYNHAVKLTVWDDGFNHDITDRVYYVDPITHELRIEVKPGELERVAFDSVVGVKVLKIILHIRGHLLNIPNIQKVEKMQVFISCLFLTFLHSKKHIAIISLY